MRRLWLAYAALALATVGSVFSAANAVPSTKAARNQQAIDANALKPDECAALDLTAVVTSGAGTAASELIVGTGGADTLDGGDGSDCIVAGPGDDTIDGGAGTDVCLGGGGTDSYANCEAQNDPDPSSCTAPGTQTVTSNADTYVKQDGGGDDNFGTATTAIVTPNNNKVRRVLVSFALPSLPAGCTATANLRLYNGNAATGRTIQVYRAAAAWGETTAIWNTQPGFTGTAVTAASAAGWMQWNVDAHVQAMYSGANYGFLVKDSSENSNNQDQQFHSRENTNDPQLVITFG